MNTCTYTVEPLYNGHHWDQQTCPFDRGVRSFNIIKYQNGTRKVSFVVRCPLFRGVLYKGFHCTYMYMLLQFPTNFTVLLGSINCVLAYLVNIFNITT